jgi:hypothetical protein
MAYGRFCGDLPQAVEKLNSVEPISPTSFLSFAEPVAEAVGGDDEKDFP